MRHRRLSLLSLAFLAGLVFLWLNWPQRTVDLNQELSVHLNSGPKEMTLEDKWQKATKLLEQYVLSRVAFNSLDGKKYSTCIFSVTRNEHHLTEFLVRNLLAGVQHFWLLDDNRATSGFDMNITVLVEPFRRLGLVDVIPSPHSGMDTMKESDKAKFIEDWRTIATPLCRWGSVTDSDEIWYPLDFKYAKILSKLHINDTGDRSGYDAAEDLSGIGLLSQLLETLDSKYNKQYHQNIDVEKSNGTANESAKSYKYFLWGWGETDNEMRITRGKSSLMNDYPRVCYYNWHRKLWTRLDVPIVKMSDHLVHFDKNRVKPLGVNFEDSQHMFIMHYQMKSIEEYIVKMEQAFDLWSRDLTIGHRKCNSLKRRSYYNQTKAVGLPQKIPYAPTYQHIVNTVLQHWPIDPHSAYVSSPDAISIAFNGTKNWELYMYMKWAVAANHSWDNEAYLAHNKLTLSTAFDDGLHHFLKVGFYGNQAGCFKNTHGKSFCVSKKFKQR